MPTTASRAYPYPAASVAADVPYHVQALAEKVDADVTALQPVTISITPASSMVWSEARVTREGTRIFMDGRLSRGSDIGAGVLATTLPVGARPLLPAAFVTADMTGGFNPTPAVISINLDGTMIVNFITAPASTRYVYLGFSYIAASS